MKFYVLVNSMGHEGAAATDFLPVDGSKTGEAARCSTCGRCLGLLPLLPPVRVELDTWGTEYGDIAFGPGEELLISERFWKLYGSAGLIGLIDVNMVELKKLTPHQKLHEPTPNYYCCRIIRSNAVVDYRKSGLILDEPSTCQECRLGGIVKRIDRIVLEPDSWSGEDIFLARGLPGVILTSRKFVQCCEDNGVSNCKLIPADAFSFDFYPWEKGRDSADR